MFNTKKQNKLPPIVDRLLLTPASKLSKQIKDGSLTSVKLCEAYMDRIKQVQPKTNAMAQDRFKEALEEARKIDQLLARFRTSEKPETEFTSEELEKLNSPLLGVPISVKESIMIKGMRNSSGMWERRDVTATQTAVTINNVQRFGLIPICTTNIPEGTLFWADCQNKVYGRSLNPYDLSRITGASSGGEGSLISSAGSIIGIGSDIGGSLRIPASYCGIFSHKPSPFLISSEGNYPEVMEGRLRLFTIGPMSRYASDLRPLFKCLLSDKDNAKQDTYFKFQPENISQLRKTVLQRLDEQIDLTQSKLLYFNFNDTDDFKGIQSIQFQAEIMEAQQEVLDHFRTKFNCQIEHFDLKKLLKKVAIAWQCMLIGAGTVDKENYTKDELQNIIGVESLTMELIKLPFGLSNHTKESLLTLIVSAALPKEPEKIFPLCEKYEKFIAEIKTEIEAALGDNNVLITPTMPTVAHKHNVALLKTGDIRFPSVFNVLQLPVSHATMRLDKKHKLPFGFSIAAKPYNDPLTIAIAEEIELAFGGWIQPTEVINNKIDTNNKVGAKVNNLKEIKSDQNRIDQQVSEPQSQQS